MVEQVEAVAAALQAGGYTQAHQAHSDQADRLAGLHGVHAKASERDLENGFDDTI